VMRNFFLNVQSHEVANAHNSKRTRATTLDGSNSTITIL
jgi:hypothetical protein